MYVYNYNVFDLFSADQSFKDYISMRCWLGIAKLSSAYCHSVLIVTGTTSGHTSIVSMSDITRSLHELVVHVQSTALVVDLCI